jgi:hypothetical protein
MATLRLRSRRLAAHLGSSGGSIAVASSR